MSSAPQHWISLTRVVPNGLQVKLAATDDEFKQLEANLMFEGLRNIEAEFIVKPWGGNGISLTGTAGATGDQICVVSLETITNTVKASFHRTFVPEDQRNRHQPQIIDGEMIFDTEAEDYPDIVEGGRVNAWEVILEELNLVIDPHPRSNSNGSSAVEPEAVLAETPTHRPFDGLNELMNEKKNGK